MEMLPSIDLSFSQNLVQKAIHKVFRSNRFSSHLKIDVMGFPSTLTGKRKEEAWSKVCLLTGVVIRWDHE
jgi:hypothetical protein